MSDESNDYSSSWNTTYGIDKDPVRKHLVFPLFRNRVQRFSHRHIADLGCGNGSMIHNIIDFEFDELIALDKNSNFLTSAKTVINDSRVTFVEEDLCVMNSIESDSVDAALSVFVINEIADLATFFENVSRILTRNGRLFLVCTHPFTALINIKMEDWGVTKNRKVTGIASYFLSSRGNYYFTLSNDFAEYFHHNFEHIINSALNSGLVTRFLKELTTDDPAFANVEEYRSTGDLPKYLYLEMSK